MVESTSNPLTCFDQKKKTKPSTLVNGRKLPLSGGWCIFLKKICAILDDANMI